METVGAYEAKTHFAQLLDRVARGERITITKHGVAVAVLQGVTPQRARSVSEVAAEIKDLRAGCRLEGLSVREMIEEGRK